MPQEPEVFAEELEGLVGTACVEGVFARAVTLAVEDRLGSHAALDHGCSRCTIQFWSPWFVRQSISHVISARRK
jgi:hypothetical protein